MTANSTIARFQPRAMRLGCLLWLCLFVAPVSGWAIEVVVNDAVKTEQLSQYKLRTIFGMRLLTWPDGMPIRVFVLPDENPIHKEFCKEILGVFPHQLRRAWNNLVYSGLGQAPVQVANEHELIEKVASTKGAIGYLNDRGDHDNIHIISIKQQ